MLLSINVRGIWVINQLRINMVTTDIIAITETTINAAVDRVWDAFVNPQIIKKYMFGTNIVSDWKKDLK